MRVVCAQLVLAGPCVCKMCSDVVLTVCYKRTSPERERFQPVVEQGKITIPCEMLSGCSDWHDLNPGYVRLWTTPEHVLFFA